MKAHLLVFDQVRITLKEMIKIVDDMPEIENWHVVFDNTICIASEVGAKKLAGKFNAMLPELRYLVSEITPESKGGRMNKTVLDLLNAPGPVEAEHA